ncbi:MAG: ABC transporter ATP-binding protein [Egibacteraceae bacterium]
MRAQLTGVTVELAGQRIIDDIDLEAPEGQVVGVVGPNGSGKSTLLRCVYRLLRPVEGSVTVGGQDVWSLSAREAARRTAVVAQQAAGDFDFSVHEVVLMGRLPHKRLGQPDTEGDRALVTDALLRVGMADKADRGFSTLSGGERQRVVIARALAQQTKLLVLDEPTNHLDIRAGLEVLALVRGMEVTSLVALHDLNLALAYCDRLYVLAAGRVVGAGPPGQVLTPTLLWDVFRVHAHITVNPHTDRPSLAYYLGGKRPRGAGAGSMDRSRPAQGRS